MHISHMKLKMAVFYSVSPNYFKEENNVSLGSIYCIALNQKYYKYPSF